MRTTTQEEVRNMDEKANEAEDATVLPKVLPSVWVWGAPGVPFGARLLGAVPERPDSHSWLEVCILGHHLPQQYANEQIEPLVPMDCERLGLCPDCLGFGEMASTDPHNPDFMAFVRAIDQLTDPCKTCEGSGRPCTRASVTRDGDAVTGGINCLPHAYIPPLADRGMYVGMAAAFGTTEDLCMACGLGPDGVWLGGVPVHRKDRKDTEQRAPEAPTP
jgi:hypothetical protein